MKSEILSLLLLLLSLPLLPSGKSNILLITVDTLRTDRVSVYTDKFVKTPNMDRLARRGVVFKRAFAHTPLTLPSHVSIMTGTTPLYHGVSDNNRFKLDDKFLTLAEHFRASGYRTAAFTGAFVLDKFFNLDQGFELYQSPVNRNERIAAEVIKPAIKWLENQEGPWFLWVHLWDPHSPYLPPESYRSRFGSDLYSGEVAYTDHQLGILFNTLEKKGVMKNTLVVITGDHGEALGDHGELEHGFFAYNETLHIPLIMAGPGLKRSVVKKNVSHMDIFPTICRLTGATVPAHIQGNSLLPLVNGGEWNEEIIYFEAKMAFYSLGWAPLDGYIEGDTKFINLPIKEMYDLKKDFGEKRNIITRVRIQEPFRKLNQLISGLKGEDRSLSKKELDPVTQKKLKSFGYLTGVIRKPKSKFTREDDLKVLLPVQNKLTLARRFEKDGKFDEALKLLNEVRELKPGTISAYINIADIYFRTHRIRPAIRILNEGLSQSPKNIDLRMKKGILLVAAGDPAEGESILSLVVSEDPLRSRAWNHLGTSYLKRGMLGKALQAYRKSEEIDTTDPVLFNNMGTLYLRKFIRSKNRQMVDEAILNFRKALKLNPGLPSALNGMGAALRFSGNRKGAVAYWKRAVKNKPDFIEVYFNLGITLIESGDRKQALLYLNTLKESYYSRLNPRSRNQLQKLLTELE